MVRLRTLAKAIRHSSGLEHAEWLWNLLRGPYHKLLNVRGHGVTVSLREKCTLQLPPEFSGGNWESYEPETITALISWLHQYPSGVLLDVGCAVGFLSVVGLFASEQSLVIGFDSDLASLKATQRMCQYAKNTERLKLIYGFVTAEHQSGISLRTASERTRNLLLTSAVTGDPGTTAYVCIQGNTDNTIPSHSLDGLLISEIITNIPILLKCDVEGAELLVLRGAQKLLETCSPQLLLSVHPSALPSYKSTVKDVQQYLNNLGYEIRVLAVDHEEHWWCEKR
jgi:FkbM family methyltransferase